MQLISAACWSTYRIFVAYILSLAFGIFYGVSANVSPKREKFMIALLDVLQSVPILGFFPVAIAFFAAVFQGQRIGLELAAIFLIFTSQAWNIAFGVYETIKTLPREFGEVSKAFNFGPDFTVRRVYLPAMIPTIVFNSGVSMANGWYFLMASEIISLGNKQVKLPGLGSTMMSYLAQGNIWGVIASIGTIVLINALLQIFIFRPLVRWSELFQYNATGSAPEWPTVVDVLSGLGRALRIDTFLVSLVSLGNRAYGKVAKYVIYGIGTIVAAAVGYLLYWLFTPPYPWDILVQIPTALTVTAMRVIAAVVISVLLALPFVIRSVRNVQTAQNIYSLASILGSIPAVIFYPPIVALGGRSYMELLSILLLLTGSFWYALFNMSKGAMLLPGVLTEMSQVFNIKGWLYYKNVLIPAILPPLITGALTAWGGAWNASIVAEHVQFGDQVYSIPGIGSLLTEATSNTKALVLTVLCMTVLIVLVNMLFWRPWYSRSAEKYNITE
ncbi:ABC transporter permease subunit [Coprothermobacter platensis]|uniref:ABC transporter permease subunit n=1 Tax=Coprothermobacter platensis TaxID=108819 RepID=UPI0003640284|nr:ABC transporter permease subunit [Coprothermobacter platensis]